MINTQSFVLYESVYKHIQTLKSRVSTETALKYINAVMEFGLYGVLPDEDNEVWIYGFEQAMTSIYSSKEKYCKTIENGKKGGAPRKYDHDLIVELKEQGLTNKQVAEEIGCSEITVTRAIKERELVNTEIESNHNDKSNHNLNEKENEKGNKKETEYKIVKVKNNVKQINNGKELYKKNSIYSEYI